MVNLLAAAHHSMVQGSVGRAAVDITTSLGSQSSIVSSRVLFWIFAVMMVLSALMTITRKNAVIAALFLVLCLFSTGGMYLLLNASFVAAMQILVYAGAVMVLFMFVVMAVAHYDDPAFNFVRDFRSSLWSKSLGLIAILFAIAFPVLRVFRANSVISSKIPSVEDAFGTVTAIGWEFFGAYLFPFEAISVLLLVAIVGSVVVTRTGRPTQQARRLENQGRAATLDRAQAREVI